MIFQVANRLLKRTMPNRFLYLGEIVSGGKDFKPKMDELVSAPVSAVFLYGLLQILISGLFLARYVGVGLEAGPKTGWPPAAEKR